MNDKALSVYENGQLSPLSAADLVQQVNLIQQVMKAVMKEDTHYGKIPGTDRPMLYRPGAEKLCMLFRLRAQYEVNREDLEDGHRAYEVLTTLRGPSGDIIGQGVGYCSTMESKYRWRWENTGALVPQAFWESRDRALIGGNDFTARKVRQGGKQVWMIFHRVEHDNPTDYYNTALKIAKKRSHSDATLTCTAASDIFQQEEIEEDPALYPDDNDSKPQADEPRARPKAQEQPDDGTLNATQLRIVRKKMESRNLDSDMVCAEFGVEKLEDLPVAQINEVLEWLESASN